MDDTDIYAKGLRAQRMLWAASAAAPSNRMIERRMDCGDVLTVAMLARLRRWQAKIKLEREQMRAAMQTLHEAREISDAQRRVKHPGD